MVITRRIPINLANQVCIPKYVNFVLIPICFLRRCSPTGRAPAPSLPFGNSGQEMTVGTPHHPHFFGCAQYHTHKPDRREDECRQCGCGRLRQGGGRWRGGGCWRSVGPGGRPVGGSVGGRSGWGGHRSNQFSQKYDCQRQRRDSDYLQSRTFSLQCWPQT